MNDHEEEFYYTEVEEEGDEEIGEHMTPTALPPTAEVVESAVPAQSQSFYSANPGWMASSPPTLSHMDMARPPHEGKPVLLLKMYSPCVATRLTHFDTFDFI